MIKKSPVISPKHLADPLPVMEHFYTLQGEGAWTGTPAYFIRLAGCDVGCHWCDVKESWPASDDQQISVKQLAHIAAASGTKRVVITGGEPTMYDLNALTEALHAAGLKIHLETSGAHPFTGKFDWICLSPKKFVRPLPAYYQIADELKVVVYNKSDFDWAEKQAAFCTPKTQRYLQPEWSKMNANLDQILDYVKTHPEWRLSLQTHKFIDIP